MPIDVSIYGNQQRQPSLLENVGQVLQMKTMLGQQAAQAQAQELGALQLQQHREALAEDAAYKQVMQKYGGDLQRALPDLMVAAPGKGMAVGKYLSEKSAAELTQQKTKLDIDAKHHERMGALAAAGSGSPGAAMAAIQKMAQEGLIQADEALSAYTTPPGLLVAKMQQLANESLTAAQQKADERAALEEQFKRANEARQALLFPAQLKTAQNTATTGTPDPVTGLTKNQAVQAEATKRAFDETVKRDENTARHQRVMENKPVAGMGGLVAREIKPDTPEYKVAQDLAYGRMRFNMFRTIMAGSKDPGLKASIYAKAADLNPRFNPTSYEMGYALAASPKVGQQLASMDNVVRGVPDLLAISDEATRSGSRFLNQFITKGGIEVAGKKYSNLHLARVGFADELSGALGFGGATDMSRQMGIDLTDTNLSPADFRSAIQDVVMPFIERKRASLLDQMGIYGTPEFNPAARKQEEEGKKNAAPAGNPWGGGPAPPNPWRKN